VPRGQAGQDVFHAIADGNRRLLIDLMEPGPRAVGELVLASGMSYSATSQHLAILRRAGLVSSEASGRRRIYRLRPAGLREIYDWSGRYREFWRGRLDALRETSRADCRGQVEREVLTTKGGDGND
jgi:DNA-binding transcriptional ArsR family regulator